jgi:glycosyltransferase involved in cell wall biosynthesis
VKLVGIRGSTDPNRSRGIKAGNLVLYWLKLLPLIWRFRRNTIHFIGTFSTRSTFLGIIEWVVVRSLTKRTYLTVHNLLPHNSQSSVEKLAFKVAYKLPHYLVIHTQAICEPLVSGYGVLPDRVIFIEHGLNVKQGARAQSADWIPSKPLRILAPGVVSPYKGTDILLDAIKHMPEGSIDLQIIGMCTAGKFCKLVEDKVNALAQTHLVKWDNRFVSESELSDAYSRADLVVLPYRAIYQSGVLFQSLSFQVPICASDVGEFRKYLPDGVGAVFPPADVSALAALLREVLNGQLRFTRAQIHTHASQFDWQLVVRPLTSHYKCVGSKHYPKGVQ